MWYDILVNLGRINLMSLGFHKAGLGIYLRYAWECGVFFGKQDA